MSPPGRTQREGGRRKAAVAVPVADRGGIGRAQAALPAR